MASQRILFVINSLGTGGAERVLANLVAARWQMTPDAEVHLALLDELPHMRVIAPIDGCHQLDGRGSLRRSAWQLRRLVRRLKPDVVVSFLIRSNCAAVLATAGLAIRTVICERMHGGSHLANNYEGIALVATQFLLRSLYPRADRVLAVSEGVRANLIRQFRVPPGRVRTIVNPYDLPAIRQAGAGQPGYALPDDFCICVGRLVQAKDVAKVITTFAAERPTRDLLVLGDGPLRSQLAALSQGLGIDDHVHFLGFLDDPFPIVSRARFLVSASRNEGFPNSAAEAMAMGVPVILTDCPSGPAELLDGGQYGILVPLDDDDALRRALRLMRDPQERAALSRLARTRMEAFAAPEIARAYWREFVGDDESAP